MRSAGAWFRRYWLLLAGIFAASLWLGVQQEIPFRYASNDAAEYADVARRLARGDGFTTSLIYPAELEFGVHREHPALVRPPLWPSLLAAAFVVFGPGEWAIQVVLLGLYVLSVVLAGLLGQRLAGLGAGIVAASAVAVAPDTLALSLVGMTETLYGVCILLVLWLLARGSHPVWVGVGCAALYLTRYNGIVLLPFALLYLVLSDSESRGRRVSYCLLGFVLLASPWWVRNTLVTGEPFFTYYQWAIYFPVTGRTYTTTLLHLINPTPDSPLAMDPLEKVRILLPLMFLNWPLAAANFSACVGLGIACVKRNALGISFAGLAVATTVGLSLALPRGRYFAPLFPGLLVLGVAGWWSLKGRVKWLGLALLLASPLLPPVIDPAPDLVFARGLLGDHEGRTDEEEAVFARCVRDQPTPPIIVAEDASRVVWQTDATTIWLPATSEDFWRIVSEYPVRFVYMVTRQDLLGPRFSATFAPRKDCGPGFYERLTALN
jgi:4-amino-4-deoxy-L-arabinose transferase-like glycosyltransferase